MSQHSDQGVGAAASPPVAAVDDGSHLTVGGILTVASILVLFAIVSLGISYLHFWFHSLDRRRGGAQESSPSRRGGVDPELLRSLPVTVYRAGAAAKSSPDDDAAVECAVCLAELEDGEEARFLPRCGHGFHVECIDMWLASHTTCPLCRLTVAKATDVTPAAPVLAPPALPPVPHERPANYASNLPASVLLLGVSGNQLGAATAEGPATLVIEIPESAAPTPCDATKSPGSARLRSIRRLWSFGTQGAGSSSSCTHAGGSERVDVELGTGVTFGIAVAEAKLPAASTSGRS